MMPCACSIASNTTGARVKEGLNPNPAQRRVPWTLVLADQRFFVLFASPRVVLLGKMAGKLHIHDEYSISWRLGCFSVAIEFGKAVNNVADSVDDTEIGRAH